MEKTDSEIVQEIVFGAIKSGKRPRLPDSLYHYTSFDVWQMLMSGVTALGCTDFRELNDSREYFFGLKQIERALLSRADADEAERKSLRSEFPRLYASLQDASYFGLWSPWVFSLSTVSDSLHQWVAYTDRTDGGVAIGLLRDKLQKLLSGGQWASDGQMCECNCCVVPCLYVDSDLHFRIDGEEVDFAVIFDHLVDSLGGGDFQVGLMKTLMLLSAMIKNDSFACENEWRVIMQSGETNLLTGAKVVGNKLRVPFASQMSLRELIGTVVIAPHGNKILARRNAFLPKLQDTTWKYKVISSKLSYRSV